jgi:RNA polymerase sigma-70 factor (ECF subfamily)
MLVGETDRRAGTRSTSMAAVGPDGADEDGLLEETDGTDGFVAFFEREHGRLVGLLLGMTGSRVIAEDVAQEAFATALDRWGKVRGLDRPDLWLRRVALNRAIGVARRRVTEQRALTRLATFGRPLLVAVDAEPGAGEPAVLGAIRALPPRQRQVVGLVYLDERTIDEAAQALGLTASTVRTHLERARAALAAALGAIDDSAEERP